MTDKKEPIDKKNKPSEEELQQWLDSVHLGSCCSDPLISDVESSDVKNKSCDIDGKDKAKVEDEKK